MREWLCKFCHTWNVLDHRFCRTCLARKHYATKEER